ncbi:MAG: hypothetical protein ACD_15C00195G0003 [uncultured bacterium]|nr:MAG: hypothetical protein ACD_15C00195G0003 [uncultured bacterium]HCU70505.1 hypothetical protein [Candidatus Moranbacteria bacterium]
MQFRIPKNSDKYFWTLHAIEKMRFYGLSEQKVLGVIRRPKRKEEGIVKNTIAVMQPISPKTGKDGKTIWKTEIWVMYQIKKNKNSKNLSELQRLLFKEKIKIISAWRYPGVSPEKNPIPEDILREIEEGDLEME